MKPMFAWIEQRTGMVSRAQSFLYAPLPGGARWRHTWVTLLLFAFFAQAVTGFFLLTQYSASTQTAWESVYYLQHQVPGGALLRGLHSINAQLFVVLLAIHVVLTVLHRAHLPPREVSYWLLLVALPMAVALSVTGWLLPLDQKGYWAARVPLNLVGIVPFAGPVLQQLLIGGPEIGHLTLTRFLALHAVLLPLLTGGVLVLHWALRRRHGPAGTTASGAGIETYWPAQALKDAWACVAFITLLLLVVLWPWLRHGHPPGVELLAPADPSEPYAAARPEWHLLWLFQFLKLFPGRAEIWGAVVIPGLVFLAVAALPWLGRWRWGQAFSAFFLAALVLGASVLTAWAIYADYQNPTYQAAVRQARLQAERARALAEVPSGIPSSGALSLVQRDPLTQGPLLFARHCAGCHRFGGHDGTGTVPREAPSAADLKGFASRAWLTGLLDPDHVASTNYFGGTRFAEGRMVRFVRKKLGDLEPEGRAQLQKMIAALSAEAALPGQAAADHRDTAQIQEGRTLMKDAEFACRECHTFREPDPDATAPTLTGYGSREWLIQFVTDPSHERFYGQRNDRMPAFGREEILSPEAIGLLADWLRDSTR